MSLTVSVVIAIHNGRRFLPMQIASMLAELEPTDEVVAIDDASNDGSADWLLGLGDTRLRLHRNPTNLGVLASFERGLALANHEIVFLCDQDDIWLPGKRAAFIAAFEREPRTLVVVSDAQVIDAYGVVTAPSFMATRGGFRSELWRTVWRNRYLGCAMAFRRELLSFALPIPRHVPMHDMWLGLLGHLLGEVRYLPTPFLQYRRHDANASPARSQGWARMIRWRGALLSALLARRVALRLGWHVPMAATSQFGDPNI